MKNINIRKMSKTEEDEEEEEPASPSARLMQAKEFNICIISVIGYKTTIDPSLYKKSVEQTLLKHPRFSCLLVKNNGKCSWKRAKNVDIDDHVILVPDVEAKPEDVVSDKYVEDFASDLSKIHLDMTKPLWEIYILNVRTSDANAIAIFKLHHSMGDGVSLMALCHACSRKISDPESLPVIPSSKKHEEDDNRGLTTRFFALVWIMFCVVFNTLVDCVMFLSTMLFLKDRETPIKAAGGHVLPYKRFVHRIVDLDEVKLVKNAMNVVKKILTILFTMLKFCKSINDVVLGITEAGLSRYLHTRYEKEKENSASVKKGSNYLPRNLHLRSAVVFNLRPSPTIEDLVLMMENEELNGMWGNVIGVVLFPFTIDLQEDPLTHIRRAKLNMDKKKLSLGHKCAFFVMKLMMLFFGTKTAASATRAVFRNTTLTFSNVVGPQEEVNLFGHPLSYIAPSVYGFPQSLIVHYQSYADKLIISIGADENLIPNPHQLCDDLVKSLRNIKEAAIKRGLINSSHFC